MNELSLSWKEEYRYLSNDVDPRRRVDARIRMLDEMIDVDIYLDSNIRVTGVALSFNDVMIRYERGDKLIYSIFKGAHYKNAEEKNMWIDLLKNKDVLKSLINLDKEDVINKKLIIMLREYADKLESELGTLRAEIRIEKTGVCVRLLGYVDEKTFRHYISTCKKMSMLYESPVWCWHPSEKDLKRIRSSL